MKSSNFFTVLKFKITKSVFVRALLFPFMNVYYFLKNKIYRFSKDSTFLKTKKAVFNGKRCFIIGNGPSLTVEDLESLKDEYTFAANRIYYLFNKTSWRPTFYCCIDKSIMDQNASEIPVDNLECCFFDTYGKLYFKRYHKSIHYLPGDNRFFLKPWKPWKMYITNDASKKMCSGCTVTFASIQLAIYMGFTEIYLLGVDHNYSVKINSKGQIIKDDSIVDYVEGMDKTAITAMCVDVTTAAYDCANKYAKSHGIKIINCTKGGKLEAFERRTLKAVLLDK